MRRLSILFLMLLLVLGNSRFAHAEISSSPDYNTCVAMTQKNPQGALEFARQWAERGGAQGARHCKAMALFALRQYSMAAQELETLADNVTDKQPVLWLSVLSQAGKARMASNEMPLAYRSINTALTFALEHETMPGIQPLMLSLLADRADAYVRMGKPLDGIQDIDHAIAIAERDTSLLLRRAAILAQMKEHQMAAEDIAKALTLEPDNAQARIMQAELKKTEVIR